MARVPVGNLYLSWGWRRGDRGGRGYEGGGWSGIKYEISRMYRIEHNTNIGRNVMNADDIEKNRVFSC